MSFSKGPERLFLKEENGKNPPDLTKLDLRILFDKTVRQEGIKELIQLFKERDGFNNIHYNPKEKAIELEYNGVNYIIGNIDFKKENGEILIIDNYKNTIFSVNNFFNNCVKSIEEYFYKDVIKIENIRENIDENLSLLEKSIGLIPQFKKEGDIPSWLDDSFISFHDDIKNLSFILQKFKEEKIHQDRIDYLDLEIPNLINIFDNYVDKFNSAGIIK